MKRDRQPRLPQRLYWSRLAEHPRAGRDENLVPAVRVDRVSDQAIERRGSTSIEAICEYRVDDRSFKDAVKWPRVGDGIGACGARWSRPPLTDCCATVWQN